jgi:uncharacterized membrane protein
MEPIKSKSMATYTIIQIIAVTLVGLAAGLFYSYSCSVVNGLGKLDDKEYLLSFQSINREIINPVFMLSFMGSLIVLPIAAWMTYKNGAAPSFYFLLAAAIVYAVGVFGITMAGNVPLNNMVDKFDIGNASVEALRSMRDKFENKWNTLQHVRTLANITAFVLSIIALIKRS